MSASDVEREALEYVLGLDGLGLGVKAKGIMDRATVREIRPLALRQKALLEASLRTGADNDAAVKALDGQLEAAWRRCLMSLKTLWLTEGPQEAEEA